MDPKDVKDPADPSTVGGAPTDSPPESDPSQDDPFRSLLSKDFIEPDDDSEQEIPIDDAVEQIKDDAPGDPPTEEPPEPEAQGSEPSNSEGEDPEVPEEPPADAPDDSYPSDEEVDSYTPNSQKRIRQLVDARRRVEAELAEAKKQAAYGESVGQMLESSGITPQSWDQWTQLGLQVQQSSGPEAAKILRAMADNLDPAGSSAPAASDTQLDDDLEELVNNLEMSQEAAEKIQATRQTPAPAAPVAAPAIANDPSEVGAAAVEAVNAEYAQRYPSEWDKLVPEVQKEMAKYKGAAPHLWGQIARDAAEKVIARRRGKSPAAQPDPVTRARSGQRPKSAPKTNTREGLAASIADGSYFKQ